MAQKDSGYVAPRRKYIKDEVCKLLPHVDPKLIKKLDYWALYTIHQDVVKDGKSAEELARRLIKGYDPDKIAAERKKAEERKAREEERKKRAKEIATKKAEAKKKAAEAKAKARAAKEAARAKAAAAKARAKAKKPKDKETHAGAAGKTGEKTSSAKSTAAPAKSKTPKDGYIPPIRKHIKDELAKLMPMIKRSDLTGLDYWALYTMHSEISKYGTDPEQMARKFIKGYVKKKK
jgi:hypothetical protein